MNLTKSFLVILSCLFYAKVVASRERKTVEEVSSSSQSDDKNDFFSDEDCKLMRQLEKLSLNQIPTPPSLPKHPSRTKLLNTDDEEPLWVDPRRGSRLYANRGKLRKSKSPALLGAEAFSDREQRTLEKFHERFERERKIAREERKRRSNERRLESETEEESDEEMVLDKENTDSEEMEKTDIRKGGESDEKGRNNNGKEKVERNDKRKSHSGDREEKKAQKGRKEY